uniref:Protein kinase domain-containing protein n=1 Tax=Candidatus Kentrum sp. MB TaxID=2138164 RepID=A0A450XCS6_9GAMM|nr:MAG: hypothetical protein BECKMB1821G_GA0114241_100920 [Candidatus Kentron sp. MB]VFK27087.1 MAG: hypothetical protein BECKMB1821I_GA0114274_100232 [Candidatus Kentron sp. MB]VFK74912.1 MAG: hypothetical protein BECKMB1821H_GA0114242_101221 [Candidatus Kentron sp. MB]
MDKFDSLIGATVANQYLLERLVNHSSSQYIFEVSRRADSANTGFSRFGVKSPKNPEEAPKRGLLVIAEPETGYGFDEVLGHWRQWRANADPTLIACYSTDAITDGPLQGAIFAFTEFGVTLGAATSDEPLAENELFRAFRSVAQGLASVHNRGTNHGGVSAWNIVNVDGQWKLALSADRAKSSAADDILALAVVFAVALTDPQNDHQYDPYGLPIEQLLELRKQLQVTVEEPYRTLLLRCLEARKETRPPASALAQEPMPLPEAIHEVAVQRSGGKCMLSWNAPTHGDVHLIKVADVRSIQEGALVLASDIPEIGELLVSNAATPFEVTVDDNQPIAIVPVTEHGPLAIPGYPLVIGSLEDVTIQHVDVDCGEVVIQLHWPRDIQNALIVMRPDKRS